MTAPCAIRRLATEGPVDEVVENAVKEIAASSGVLSLPTLCNRLWFDVTGDGYDGPAASALMGEIPAVAHGFPEGHPALGPQPAIALGAIVELDLGSDIVYGEVVWKEGAHFALEPDWTPRWLAGAPALSLDVGTPPRDYVPPEGPRVLRERLVIDFSCFGDQLAPSAAKLQRLRERAYRVDRYGHLVMDAVYPPGPTEEEDDVAFWAAWVSCHYPKALAAVGLPADPECLKRAAFGLADSLTELDEVRSFGPYVIHSDTYERLVAEDTADAQSFSRTAHGLVLMPRNQTAGWAAMSARLCETREEAMWGTQWPTATVVASLFVLDLLATEAPTGDWNGVHLRLDDPWQGGGLWRAEVLGEVGPVAADPAVALGLGWVEHTGGTIERVAGPLPDDLVPLPDWLASDGVEWELSGSEACWSLYLTRHDVDTDRLRVPNKVALVIRATLIAEGQDQLVVNLHHDSEGQAALWCRQRDDGHLEVPWPLGMLPGTTMLMSWSVGGLVVNVSTRLMAEPVVVHGVTYRHEFNEQVALAALGLAETTANPVTLHQLVRAVVRRDGEVTEDGCRCLSVDDVARRCFGPSGEVAPAFDTSVLRRAVLNAALRMVRAGDARLERGMIVLADTTPSGQRADRGLLERYVDKVTQRVRREVARHWVPPSVVNLPPSWQASPEKRESWGEVAGTEGLPDTDLGEHQTWRTGHLRGGRLPPLVAIDLERVRQAMTELTSAAGIAMNIIDLTTGSPAGRDAPTELDRGRQQDEEEPHDA
jgi:hypothetical protein